MTCSSGYSYSKEGDNDQGGDYLLYIHMIYLNHCITCDRKDSEAFPVTEMDRAQHFKDVTVPKQDST